MNYQQEVGDVSTANCSTAVFRQLLHQALDFVDVLLNLGHTPKLQILLTVKCFNPLEQFGKPFRNIRQLGLERRLAPS